jgi:exodeoxyribonuclease VII small subunit
MTDRAQNGIELAKALPEWESLSAKGTFEEALDALETIVHLLDEGNLPLETSVRCFEIGTRLSDRCAKLLEDAELRITILSAEVGYDGDTTNDPWDVDSLDDPDSK